MVSPSPNEDDTEPLHGTNPIHTGIFVVLFVLTVGGLPFLVRGWAGFLMAPVVGAALWGLYKITLPRGPEIPDITATAGSTACPACASFQTDRRPAADPGEPTWQCFGCEHRWTPS